MTEVFSCCMPELDFPFGHTVFLWAKTPHGKGMGIKEECNENIDFV